MIRYLELPKIPNSIIDNLPADWKQYDQKVSYSGSNYTWTDSFNQEINSWCQEHISQGMYFGFQIMTGNVPMHKDVGTLTKLVYLLQPGGKNVTTNFYNDDRTLAHSFVIEPFRWHVLRADSFHSVDHIEPDQVRFSITGRIFP